MILDDLVRSDRYAGLVRGLREALEFLRTPEAAGLEPPAPGPENSLRVAIDGERVFALVQRSATRAAADSFWEAHARHIDVQCVVEGAEMLGHAPLARMRVVKPYDVERDLTVLAPAADDDGVNWVRLGAGMFAIFFPEDAHMPGLSLPGAGHSREVKKIVMKVGIDE